MFKQLTSKRSNTCWAHAIGIATGKSYDYTLFQGRKMLLKKGMDYSQGMMFEDIVELAGVIANKPLQGYTGSFGTLKEFVSKNPKGKFIVCSRAHAMAVVDGVVYDFKKRMNFKIVDFIVVG